MHEMAVQRDQEATRMYVIMRVSYLLSDDKGLNIYVDPVRLKGTYVDFEAEGWVGRTL